MKLDKCELAVAVAALAERYEWLHEQITNADCCGSPDHLNRWRERHRLERPLGVPLAERARRAYHTNAYVKAQVDAYRRSKRHA